MENQLADIVLFHRKAAGLSRNELALIAGVGKTAIYDVEKGKETVQMATLRAILKALNIDITYSSPLMETYEKSRRKDP